MEEFFDAIETGNLSGTNSFTCEYELNPATSVQNPEEIIAELYQLSELPPKNQEQGPQSNRLTLQDPPNIDNILSVDDSLIAATSHNVGVINAACQQVLREMEQQLLALLRQNRKEQEAVQNFLSTNGKMPDSCKKTNVKCAGIPYFKDLNGYPPPYNEDVLRKKKENKLLPTDIIETSSIWSNNDARALLKAVSKNSENSSQPMDWMKISVIDMEGKYSPSECKSKWMMNLSPNVNRSKWSLKEMKLLKELAGKYNNQDWDRIATELGTNRTCLQCCVQFQAHNPLNKGKWSKEEDETLKNLIEKYKVRDYIPWRKVTWHFERRSLRQCQERYAYHLVNIKKGNFTMEEDFVLTYLATKLKNFGEVAKFLPKRVSPQIRARYEYLVQITMPKFTEEEDKLLMQLMVKYPRNWSKISEFFKDRSKVQCRRRWAYLQRNIKVNTDESDSEEVQMQARENKKKTKKDRKDAQTVVNHLGVLPRPRPDQKNKRYPGEYKSLLMYHQHCHRFLFGPKPRVLTKLEECQKLSEKMRVVMTYLSVGPGAPLPSFGMKELSDNCEFSGEDVDVLNALVPSQEAGAEIELSNRILPPNYMTLVGLRTLFLSWENTRTACASYNPPTPSQRNHSGDRILASNAKKLFKARMKALFAFPLFLSNISQEGMQAKPVSKGKPGKKSKPLSKRRRKEHSKLMSQAYREKLQQKVKEQCLATGLEEDEDLRCQSEESEVSRKRSRPAKTHPAKRSRGDCT